MEYNHERAVADGVNVNYDVYRIQTEITAQGAKIDAGFYVDKRDRQTRKKRWEQLDDDFSIRRQPARPRRGRRGPDPHGDADLSRQALHGDLSGTRPSAQDADLRQRRLPRRRYRAHLPRGFRQRQRLLPKNNLPHRVHARCREESRSRWEGDRGSRLEKGRPISRRTKFSRPFATATTRASPSPST